MNSQSFKGILLAGVLLLAGSAFAANKGSLDLQHPATVGGKQLATGSYTVRWDGAGDQVELKVYQGKNVVASIPAHVVKVDRPSPTNATVMNTNADGSYSVAQIRFGGKTYALDLTAGDSGSSSAAGAAR